jgi:hypothetical protein
MVPMEIEILHIDECPNWVEAGVRVDDALKDAGIDFATVAFRLLTTSEEVASLPFAGSPTILIDGRDAFPDAPRSTELACRIYRTPTGLAGLPTTSAITAALTAAL